MKASSIKCLITAGPTREFFDPVRYVSNPSSGKMGYAIAEAALRKGWEVHLITGPVMLKPPIGAHVEEVITGAEMFAAVNHAFDSCDILIMTAALIDFRPKEIAPHKVKKDQLSMMIEMEPVVDVLGTVAKRKENQLVVGFAAETNNVEDYALRKLHAKNADFIVANRIGQKGSGFESDENSILLLGADGSRVPRGPALKSDLGEWLVTQFSREMSKRRA